MSRLRWITGGALGAVGAVLLLAGVVESGCAAPASPAPPLESRPGEAREADALVSCVANGTGQTGYRVYKNLFWGNLHQHTALSLDAYAWGAQTSASMPAAAYAFAKTPGTALTVGGSGPTASIQSQRALDFLAITDHSEWTAVTDQCLTTGTGCSAINYNPAGLDHADKQTEKLCGFVTDDWPDATVMDAACLSSTGSPPAPSGPYYDFWSTYVIGAANDAYAPCTFTSLVAYEWSGMTSGLDGTSPGTGYTNHRNVIFNNGTPQSLPATPCDSLYCAPSPGLLWNSLDGTCTAQNDCAAVTIPHNSNESDGKQLNYVAAGSTLMRQQSQYQVAVEIYQHKGNSECYPYQGEPKLSGASGAAVAQQYDQFLAPVTPPADPYCQFEQSTLLPSSEANNYVRGALEIGTQAAALAGQGVQGTNPLQLGIVGATDDHNAAPGYVEEEVYAGHHGNTDDTASLRFANGATFSPGGLTGVWAEQNTRDRIFAAIQRRETYATSGPRIQVRFYETPQANWGAAEFDPNFPQYIVDHGAIPMGGTFGRSNLGPTSVPPPPSFVIQAVPDTAWPQASPAAGGIPGSGGWCQTAADCTGNGGPSNASCRNNVCVAPVGLAATQAVQIIKGYSVYSGGTLTTTEDPPYYATATSNPSIWTWTDPYPTSNPPGTFSQDAYAFYYVRVLQASTYRWSHWDCHPQPTGACAGGTCSGGATCTQGVCIPPAPAQCANLTGEPDTVQERAWTSPIWYSPVRQYTVVAGSGVAGDSTGPVPAVPPVTGGPAAQIGNAEAYGLAGMAKDAQGNLYIADSGNSVIRKVDPWGLMTIFAGTNGVAGTGGDTGPAVSAKISGPAGVAVDSNGNVYFSEAGNNDVRVVDTQGTIWTYATLLGPPSGIAIDGHDNIYVAMATRQTIVQLPAAVNQVNSIPPSKQPIGAVMAWTVGPPPAPGNLRWLGTLSTAGYNATEEAGASSTPTTAAGLVGGAYGGNVLLSSPNGIWADASGNVYVDDAGNGVIRKVTTKSQGSLVNLAGYPVPYQVTTIAGKAGGTLSGNTTATQTFFGSQHGVVADGIGNVYIADTYNNRITRVDTFGEVFILTPGTGGPTSIGGRFPSQLTGPAAAVAGTPGLTLYQPGYAWLDPQGAMYVSDLNAGVYKLAF